MRPRLFHALAALACCSMLAVSAAARPIEPPELASESPQPDFVGDVDGSLPAASKVLQDTMWIADWTFDVFGGGCTDAGWVKYDNRIGNDGSNYWSIDTRFSGIGGITDQAAVLAKHDITWVRDGYGNNWDYSIILKYQGASTLTFSYLSDSEPGFDFVTVEADSAGASESRVDLRARPLDHPAVYRSILMYVDGPQNATAGPISLPDFGVPATIHEAYIRFSADNGYSDQDGLYPTAWNAGLVVDAISVSGGLTYTEDFEGPLDSNVSFANTASATPFGEWARLYQHITDNDKCTENTTCAWLWSDPELPAYFPNMAFGPGGAVVRNWLDDIVASPWVDVTSTPGALGTVLSYRRFPGNDFLYGRIVQNWSIRSLIKIDNTDTPAPGDSIDSVEPWRHAPNFNSLTAFSWNTSWVDLSDFIDAGARAIQVRFRVMDWQWIAGASPPTTLNTGPGPFIDRVRIGRRVLMGPVLNPGIDVRTQAQDCFPTYRNSILPGEHHSPTADIFGSCAFSMATDVALRSGPDLCTGDSITMSVHDARGAGGVTQVRWYGAITQGPHAGKAPSPWAVGSNGFFEVTPDSARMAEVVPDLWFVDLDDTYFRGGDVLFYFWSATDAGGGRASFPQGITAANFPPASFQEADLATGGLCEVSFLPTIDWSPGYLARIATDPHGDLDPTPAEIAESHQATCILYYAAGFGSSNGRRSGDVNRTSFMYTLDRLGYRGHYDVYDHQGYGSTNNQIGGRATIAQVSGYALIVHDTGRGVFPNLPDGSSRDGEKVDQCQWYRDYLAQGLTGTAGIANLWLIGEDNAFSKATNPLIATDLGLGAVIDNHGLSANPNVVGEATYTFSNGNVADFTSDLFALQGGCVRGGGLPNADYDAAEPSGTAMATHRYSSGTTTDGSATIMNRSAAMQWNTIWMGFSWFDIRDPSGASPASGTGAPDTRLARTILNAVLPAACVQGENPTGTPGPEAEAVPAVTALHPNVPNPFNPTTTIRFDLAQDCKVRLQVFDVGGRLVTTLADDEMTRGFGKTITWSGLDDAGHRVPSGVYFYRLTTDDVRATRKMVALE